MTSPEIFLRGEQRLVTYLLDFPYCICHGIFQLLRDVQSNIMKRIYNRTTPEEQKWIVRIILKGAASTSQQVLLKILIAPHLRFKHLSQGDHRLFCLSS
jgi:hypothetical protein